MNKQTTLALNNEQVNYLKKYCAEAEKKGALTPVLLKIIYNEKWFKLFVPKKFGGLGLSLPEALKYEEQLAYIDGSLGWTVTLCAGANHFVGYIEESQAKKIFNKKKVCLGGSGAPSGIATQTKDGYIINGFWKYATGAPHLTHFTANCVIVKNGKKLLNKDGAPQIKSFFFKKEEVTIYKDWNTMGLKATAGNSFSIKNLKVNANRSFIIHAAHAKLNDPIYQYPFLPLAESTIAVNTLGMTNNFLDLAETIVKQRTLKLGQNAHKQAVNEITKAKQKIKLLSETLYQSVQTSWDELLQKEKISKQSALKIGVSSRQLVRLCRENVAAIYPYCGLAATSQTSEVNRVFRDIFTVSQHGLLTFKD